MNKIYLALAIFVLSSCTETTIYTHTYQPTLPQQIYVLRNGRPNCPYEEMGHIKTGDSWSLQSAINKAKETAAKNGADGIIMNGYFQRRGILYATMFKCTNGTLNTINPDKAIPHYGI